MSAQLTLAARRRSADRAWLGVSPATAVGALVVLGGLALRAWVYHSDLGTPNSDESIVGLMALHALHGNFTTFFWNSSYGGPQEQWLTAPVFAVAGVNYYALRALPIALTALTAVLIWRVGLRTIGSPAASFAAALFWLWPPFDLMWLTQQQSFYAADVLYCALLLLLALRVVEEPSRARVGVFGLTLGLAFWETAHIVPIAVPVIAWTIWARRQALRHAWLAAVFALAGASPWIAWNILHHWASLEVHGSAAAYRQSLRLLAQPLLPMTLGLRAPYAATLLLPSRIAVYGIYVLLIALFAAGAIRVGRRDASLLYAVGLLFPFVYAVDRRTTFFTDWPQYTVVVTPVIALLLAQVATRFWRGLALLAVAAAISVVSIPRMESWFRRPQPVPQAPRSVAPLIATLDRLGLDRVYADYWVAYRIDFATQERIVAVENEFQTARFSGGEATPPPDPEVHHRAYEREVAAAPRRGFVFFRQTYGSLPIVPLLEQHGYRRVVAGPFVVFAPARNA